MEGGKGKETKGNETRKETKRNETKQNETKRKERNGKGTEREREREWERERERNGQEKELEVGRLGGRQVGRGRQAGKEGTDGSGVVSGWMAAGGRQGRRLPKNGVDGGRGDDVAEDE